VYVNQQDAENFQHIGSTIYKHLKNIKHQVYKEYTDNMLAIKQISLMKTLTTITAYQNSNTRN
jgi:hypothetical protein